MENNCLSHLIDKLALLIKVNGWNMGLIEYFKGVSYKEAGKQFQPFARFSNKQALYKMLLPDTGQKNLFIAESSLGTLPLVLSGANNINCITVWPFYEKAAEIISTRCRELNADNVNVCTSIKKIREILLNNKIDISIFVITEDLIKCFGKKQVIETVKELLEIIAGVSSNRWVSVILYPKDVYVHKPGFFYKRSGVSYFTLKNACNKYGLKVLNKYECRGAPENLSEIRMKGGVGSSWNVSFENGRFFSAKGMMTAVKKIFGGYSSNMLILGRDVHTDIHLDKFIAEVKEKVSRDGPITVSRYFAGKPDTIILKIDGYDGQSFFCRLPLISGNDDYIVNRVETNYRMLQELQKYDELIPIIPKPVDCGIFDGQLYYIETAVAGKVINLSRRNVSEYYEIIKPILLFFYRGAGKDVLIDDDVFNHLFRESLNMLKSEAQNRGDTQKVVLLEEYLKNFFHGKKMKLPLVHGDFKIENILFNENEVRGIIDWDLGSKYGMPFIDVFYLAGYSSYYDPVKRNIMNFITSQLLSGNFYPPLDAMYDDYRLTIGLDDKWKRISGIVFWMHYVTKVVTNYPLRYHPEWYKDNVSIPLDIIEEEIKYNNL